MTQRRNISKLLLGFCLFMTSPVFAFNWVLSGTLEETVDTNVASSGEADLLSSISLGAGVSHEGRRKSLDIIGHVYQQIYIAHSEVNSNSQDLTLTGTYNLTERDTFGLNNVFLHYPEPVGIEALFGRSGNREGYLRETANVTYTKEFLRKFGTATRYTFDYVKNLSGDVADSMLHSAGTSLMYSFTSIHMATLLYDFSYLRLETAQTSIIHAPAAQYQYGITRQLTVTGGVGVSFVNTLNNEQYNNLTLTLTVEDVIDARSAANLGFIKGYEMTSSTYRVSGGYRRDLTDRWAANITLFYGHGVDNYQNTEYDLAGGSIVTTYAFTRRLEGRVQNNFTWSRTLDNEAGTDIKATRNMFMVAVTYSLEN
ncbi:MAG: hypothetical protein GY754_44520 [bacterium]|nr:hypothetical protein [bacterium]